MIKNFVNQSRSAGLSWLVSAIAVLIYLGVVAYAEVRAFSLFARTIETGLLPLAVVGVVAVGLSAIILPLAIHNQAAQGSQRIFALVFYVLDFGAMCANAILDSAIHSSSVDASVILPVWRDWVLPSLPVLVGAGWSVYWMLSPHQREKDLQEQVSAGAREVLYQKVLEAVDAADIQTQVYQAAQSLARELVSSALGVSVPSSPSAVQLPFEGMPSDSLVKKNGHVPKVGVVGYK